MKSYRIITAAFLASLAMSVSAEDYVEVTGGSVNIRTGPDLKNTAIGKGSRGEIYAYIGEEGDWYQISGFSGEVRFLHKGYSSILKGEEITAEHFFALPADQAKLKRIHSEIGTARAKAKSMAENIIPVDRDPERHLRLRTLLEDRDVLKIFKKYDIHPGLYDELVETALRNNW